MDDIRQERLSKGPNLKLLTNIHKTRKLSHTSRNLCPLRSLKVNNVTFPEVKLLVENHGVG